MPTSKHTEIEGWTFPIQSFSVLKLAFTTPTYKDAEILGWTFALQPCSVLKVHNAYNTMIFLRVLSAFRTLQEDGCDQVRRRFL